MAFSWIKKLFLKGKGPRQITSSYFSSDRKTKDISFPFELKFFKRSPEEFQMNLARLSLAKAMASYNGDGDYQTRDRHIKAFHETLGFIHIESNEAYCKEPSFDSIGVQVAHRFFFDKLRKTLLISVAIRSGHYEAEWGSNFVFGRLGHHEGFLIAAKEAYEFVADYMSKHGLQKYKRVKIWLSGFSRGGAVTNLLSAKILSESKHLHDQVFDGKGIAFHPKAKVDVYAYTFESPCPAVIIEREEEFDSIFNIYSVSDIVPFTPFPFMGFNHYGKEMQLDILPKDVSTLSCYLPDYQERPFSIKAMSKLSSKDSETQTSVAYFIKELLRFFEMDMQVSREQYVTKYQTGLSNLAMFFKTEKGDKKGLGDVSKLKLIGALASSTFMIRLVRDLFEQSGMVPHDDIESVGKSVWALVSDALKADRSYRMMHLITLKESGSGMFQYHAPELIYAYLMERDFN